MHRKQEEGFVGDGAPEADDSAFAESPAVEPTRAQQELTAQVCSLCGKPLAAGEARRLAIWTMCPGCYESLASGPAPTSGESSESSASETEEEAVQFHVRTEFMKGVNCRGCGRRVPEGGIRMVEGQPYCPDCYYSAARRMESESASGIAEKSPFPDAGSTAGPRRCDSCDRALFGSDATDVEGFTICRPCFTTDADLALSIARRRHLTRLRRIQSEIES